MKKPMVFTLIASGVIVVSAASMNFGLLDQPYKIGDTVEDFTLQNFDGTYVSLSDYKEEKGVIIIFTCNTCPYSILYEDRIIELHEKLNRHGYSVLAINPNDPQLKPGDSFAAMQTRVKDKNFPYNYLFDEQQRVYPAFGATRTPQVFLLDEERVIRYSGTIDDNPQNPHHVERHYVEEAIKAIEAGNDPSPLSTKAIGCSIRSQKNL